MAKPELRKQIRARLEAIPEDERQRRGVAVLESLCQQKEYTRAEILMIYLSLPYEIDTQWLAQRAWADMKRVLAPRVSWEQRRMLPIEVKSLATGVEEGYMGIREPVAGMPLPVSDLDLVIVPGLAYDEQGNRLGRGRGFYDQFLSHPGFHGVACAVALEEQVLESIPVGPTDVRVNMLVTDAKVRRFAR